MSDIVKKCPNCEATTHQWSWGGPEVYCHLCGHSYKKDGSELEGIYLHIFYDGGRIFFSREIDTLPPNAKKISEDPEEWELFLSPYPTRIRKSV